MIDAEPTASNRPVDASAGARSSPQAGALAARPAAWPRLAALLCLLYLWGITLWQIDRFPAPHPDEAWILSPGYKLVVSGVYGSDMFAGFHGMEQHYLQFMPLLPLLQGVSVATLGMGLFQVRFIPVAIAALTVALTFAVTRRLFGDRAAGWAILLAVTWQLHAAGHPELGSGVPLLDTARIGRYDMLAAGLGLAAFACFLRGRATGRVGWDFLAGVCVGLAGLAHIYGLFWGAALIAALLVDRRMNPSAPIARPAAAMILAAGAVWLPWLVYVARYWPDFVDQQAMQPERFDLLNLRFYLRNLVYELHRYTRGVRTGTAYGRAGVWWLLLGVPVAFGLLAHRARFGQVRAAGWLLAVLATLMGLYALLLQPKGPNYLPSPYVLLCMASGATIAWLLLPGWGARRAAAIVAVMWVVGQGLWAAGAMQARAAGNRPDPAVAAELRHLIPPGARVLAEADHWLAVTEPELRTFALVKLRSNPARNRTPVSFADAMAAAAPEYVILSNAERHYLTRPNETEHRAFIEQFWAYMADHRAELIGKVLDAFGDPILVYRLHPAP